MGLPATSVGITEDTFVAFNGMLDVLLDAGAGGTGGPARKEAAPSSLVNEPARPMPSQAELKMAPSRPRPSLLLLPVVVVAAVPRVGTTT